jgi:N,N'-diacetylchitobiose transport system permease protein
VTITVRGPLTGADRADQAALIDGARSWNVFRGDVASAEADLRHLASLSIIWTFRSSTRSDHADQRPSSGYYLMSVYSFVGVFPPREYGLGSAIAVVMVLIMLAVTFVYIRQMVKAGEVR